MNDGLVLFEDKRHLFFLGVEEDIDGKDDALSYLSDEVQECRK
jgi:hypothetical protein